ncbi:membrane-bound PQQ-dependent dehydrogenase, glucose/quinate/shikimate family [Acetobacter orleanensis]|nr:membrane-bound PQQ-dependent dehydrogenase, glucose/quinate/shikimate family [Acetobacter orleanensis]
MSLTTGIICFVGGLFLLYAGGVPYYFIVGIIYIISSILVIKKNIIGSYVIAVAFIYTIVWSISEVGFDFWMSIPRLLIPAVITIFGFLSAPLLEKPLSIQWLPVSRVINWSGAGITTLFFTVMLGLMFVPHGVVRPTLNEPFSLATADNTPSTWEAYGHTNSGDRFTNFDQINRTNVKNLKVAWIYHTKYRDSNPGERKQSDVNQNTPLQIGDTLYTCSPNHQIDAIDADTGQMRWQASGNKEAPWWHRCRGLGYYRNATASVGQICRDQIIDANSNDRLRAFDAGNGQLCPEFGHAGEVDLLEGMGVSAPGYYMPTSAPMVARGLIIVGGWIADNLHSDEPSGVIRAYDAKTGSLVWAWDLGNPQLTTAPPEGKTYTRATPNMWSTPSYDDKLGLIYVPLGNQTPDYYGVNRLKASERYSSSVVALDIKTGREKWKFQTVHHDIWDYDLPSQPELVDLSDESGKTVPALLQATKRGELFLLNRATGVPIAPVEERPVPTKGNIAEESLSPTQPFSSGMPRIGGEQFTEAKMWGVTMFDQLACRISFRRHRYDGPMTPIGLDPAIDQPGNAGGLNWGSMTIDSHNGYAYMNDMRLSSEFWLVPRGNWQKVDSRLPTDVDTHGPSPMIGTPYGVVTLPWMSPLMIPCNHPPYGTITAVNLKTRKVVWSVPAGTAEKMGPLGIPSHLPMPVGAPAYAGTSGTAGGLIFFSGFQDYYVRAYDAQTGTTLWQHPLPVGSSATPMTYISPKTGKEYLVVNAGGAGHSPEIGDSIIAFTLP